MAIYTPQAQRRRQLLIVTIAAFLVGGVLGGVVGWFIAPTPADRVTDVRERARETSAQLCTMSLHVKAGAVSLGVGGDAGARLALQRADDELTRALERAPWITADRRDALLNELHDLKSKADRAATESFANDVDQLAKDIDTTFGLPVAPDCAKRGF